MICNRSVVPALFLTLLIGPANFISALKCYTGPAKHRKEQVCNALHPNVYACEVTYVELDGLWKPRYHGCSRGYGYVRSSKCALTLVQSSETGRLIDVHHCVCATDLCVPVPNFDGETGSASTVVPKTILCALLLMFCIYI